MVYLFDVDTILSYDWDCWFVDKNEPSEPLFKISKYDYFLISSGVYKNHNNMITYNGNTYYLSNNIYDKLKTSLKKSDTPLSDIGISVREFNNINNEKVKVNSDIFRSLINKDVTVYILNYYRLSSEFKQKIEKDILTFGLKIEKWINYDKFGLTDDDEVTYKFNLISKLYESSDDKDIVYCESNRRIFDLMCKQDVIKFPLEIKYYTSNKVNPWIEKKINIETVKKYETFIWDRIKNKKK